MIRVNIICEGQTEEAFIKNLLVEPFAVKGIYLFPRLLGVQGHKGGNVKYERVAKDIRLLLGDKLAYCTTFFDFYGLDEKFPGKKEALSKATIEDKSHCLLQTLEQQLKKTLSENALQRFISYMQMHEFEGLLFSNPQVLAATVGVEETSIFDIKAEFDTPEHINNSKETAPSKRILKLYPSYNKVIEGVLIASKIGLLTMRKECKLFNNWLCQLENLTPLSKSS